jgi:hypothetical protein
VNARIVTRSTGPEPRRIYPADADPAAVRVDISPTGISSPPDIAIIAIDDPKFGDDRERPPVKIVLSQTQATRLAEGLAAAIEDARRAGA